MRAATQKLRTHQEEGSETTTFIVCDNSKQAWSLIEAESVDEAVEKAEEKGYDPRYAVEERLATRVFSEEKSEK